MIHINNNIKLANLLEKIIEKPETLTEADKVDTRDLIIELRSNNPEVILTDNCDEYYRSI